MVKQVSRNPRLVCRVSAVPTSSRGASSLTAAENCAESATTVTPQTSSSGIITARGRANTKPTASAQAPDSVIAALVISVRPQRSAYLPPSQHPNAPLPTTANVTSAGAAPCAPRACSLAATNATSHVHIAYSSHIWPRYPMLASDSARFAKMRGAARQLNAAAGAANGPSFGTSRTRSPPAAAVTAATANTVRHCPAGTAPRTRCGSADPSVSAPTSTPMASPRPSRYQPAAIFIPGGYTPASAAPVSIRSVSPTVGPEASATPTVASPAMSAHPETSRRADHRSDSVSTADTSAPTTKPSCTEIVSHAAPLVSSCHTRANAGPTAAAENHGAMAHNSEAASTASTRRGLTGRRDDPRTTRRGGTAPGGARPAP